MNVPAIMGARTVEDLVHALADKATGLAGLNLDELLDEAGAAEAAGEVLRRCRAMAGDAERGQRALDAFALSAKRQAGRLLAQLPNEPGKPEKGKGKLPSERRTAAESAGLDRTEANRLVKLAELDDGQVERIAEQLDSEGARLTISGMLKRASTTSAVEGYDGDEWYTPPEFLEAARKVFGGAIDCDPASCLIAQQHVRARAWWSKETQRHDERAAAAGLSEAKSAKLLEAWRGLGEIKDGRIEQPLAGDVWCNPPYSNPGPFLLSIVEGYNRGRGSVRAAILLVNVATDTAIQQRLLGASSARCWVGKRIAFLDPTGKPIKGNRNAQVVFYLGKHPAKFAAEFSQFGETKFDSN